jgi:hypothetical protein
MVDQAVRDAGPSAPRPEWRRLNLGWAIPAASAVVALVGGALLYSWLTQLPGFARSPGLEAAAAGASIFAVLVPLVGLVLAIVAVAKLIRAWRRSTGHLTGGELRDHAASAAFAEGWNRAVRLRAALLAGDVPAQSPHWAVVPNQGEVFLVDGDADYARYYGHDVHYTQSHAVAFGRPAFVVGVLAVNAMVNASARARAQRLARAQWRESQRLHVLATNQRLLCEVAGQGWLSFYYQAMSAIYPEAEKWTLVCQFDGGAAPLMLTGPSVPALCTVVVAATHGSEGVRSHPGLQALGG